MWVVGYACVCQSVCVSNFGGGGNGGGDCGSDNLCLAYKCLALECQREWCLVHGRDLGPACLPVCLLVCARVSDCVCVCARQENPTPKLTPSWLTLYSTKVSLQNHIFRF